MYNEELKNRYINEVYGSSTANTRARVVAVLRSVAAYEEKWGADICTRDIDDVKSAISQMSLLRQSTAQIGIWQLRSYLKWCYESGVAGATDSYKYIVNMSGIDRSESIRRSSVPNPAKLQEYMDVIFRPEPMRTIDTIYRCFFWMAYAGIELDDAFKVTCEEVDVGNMKIVHEGKEYRIYDEGREAFSIASTSGTFVYNNNNYPESKKMKARFRVPGNQLLRGVREQASNISMERGIRAARNRAKKNGATVTILNYNNIMMSGLFFRLKQEELYGHDIDFIKLAEERRKKEENDYKEPREARLKHAARFLRNDYMAWQKAWGYTEQPMLTETE